MSNICIYIYYIYIYYIYILYILYIMYIYYIYYILYIYIYTPTNEYSSDKSIQSAILIWHPKSEPQKIHIINEYSGMSEQTGWETKLSTIGLPIILSLYNQLCWRICRKHLFAHVHAPGGNKTSWQAAGVEGERYVSTSSKHRKSLIGGSLLANN